MANIAQAPGNSGARDKSGERNSATEPDSESAMSESAMSESALISLDVAWILNENSLRHERAAPRAGTLDQKLHEEDADEGAIGYNRFGSKFE